MAGLARWLFTDPVDNSTYRFEVNPKDGGRPTRKKHVQYVNTLAPDGATMAFEGRNEVQPIEWSGTAFSQAAYNAAVTWYSKRHQIHLTDDQGITTFIYIIEFTGTRLRSRWYPWKMDYTVKALVMT